MAIIPTDVLDSDSGWAAAGEMVSLKIHNGISLTAGQFVLPMSSINFDTFLWNVYQQFYSQPYEYINFILVEVHT